MNFLASPIIWVIRRGGQWEGLYQWGTINRLSSTHFSLFPSLFTEDWFYAWWWQRWPNTHFLRFPYSYKWPSDIVLARDVFWKKKGILGISRKAFYFLDFLKKGQIVHPFSFHFVWNADVMPHVGASILPPWDSQKEHVGVEEKVPVAPVMSLNT